MSQAYKGVLTNLSPDFQKTDGAGAESPIGMQKSHLAVPLVCGASSLN